MIIAFCGWQGCGKDTAADYLINWHGFKRDSFANTLKDAAADIFSWDREMLEGRTLASRQWREKVDGWWANRLEMPDLTPRWVLQYLGTEVFRHGFHDDIWIASMEKRLEKTSDSVVISDCRFPNEIAAIRRLGGRVFWIQRGGLPEWYETAVAENTANKEVLALLKSQGNTMNQKYPNIHPSEFSWVGTEFDVVVSNNGTIDELYETLKSQV